MGWITERFACTDAALGPKRFLLVPLFGAIVAFVDWVATQLAKVGMGHLIGVPSWAIGVFTAMLLVAYWLLEYGVRLRRELSSNIRAYFDAAGGGLSETHATNMQTGEFVEEQKYVRLTVVAASKKSVQSCVANIIRIERRLDLTRTEVIWADDPLPLTWAMTGEYEAKIHYLVKRFVDVAHIGRKHCQPALSLRVIPNRLGNPFDRYGTYVLTIVVTGDNLSTEAKVEIEVAGDWESFKARGILDA